MRRLLWCVVLLVSAIAPLARAAEPVDLLLVLAADVSRSVDAEKFQLQREGYAAAVANPRVLDAIRSGRNGRIAVLFVESTGRRQRKPSATGCWNRRARSPIAPRSAAASTSR